MKVRHERYIVVRHEGQWAIRIHRQHHGPYATQAQALRVAVEAAQASGKRGHQAQVQVQGADKRLRTAWTYGQDPYPPPE